jgi:hypothetical protein
VWRSDRQRKGSARARPVVMRLGHERGVELMRSRRRLDGALEKETFERGRLCIRTMLEVDLELARTRFLHYRVDGKTLDLADTVDVVDEC